MVRLVANVEQDLGTRSIFVALLMLGAGHVQDSKAPNSVSPVLMMSDTVTGAGLCMVMCTPHSIPKSYLDADVRCDTGRLATDLRLLQNLALEAVQFQTRQ